MGLLYNNTHIVSCEHQNMTPCSQVEIQFFVLTAVRESNSTRCNSIYSAIQPASTCRSPPPISVRLSFTVTYIRVKRQVLSSPFPSERQEKKMLKTNPLEKCSGKWNRSKPCGQWRWQTEVRRVTKSRSIQNIRKLKLLCNRTGNATPAD
jgi:hypothetical protein